MISSHFQKPAIASQLEQINKKKKLQDKAYFSFPYKKANKKLYKTREDFPHTPDTDLSRQGITGVYLIL